MRRCKLSATTEIFELFQLARDAALAFLDQQDEAAEAGIRMSQFLYGNCRHRTFLEIGDAVLRGQTDRLRPETLVHVWVLMGSTIYCLGDFPNALAYSERAMELDDRVNCTHRAPWGVPTRPLSPATMWKWLREC